MKNNEYEISIIIPVYNVEKYVKKCIDSVLEQSFKDFEVILVNDGSTDSSAIICNKYRDKDDRISVINKKNGGLSSARNIGIEKSRGKYITFIDSDDFISKDYIKRLYYNIINNKADISICNNKRFQVEKDTNEYKVNNKTLVFNAEKCLENLYGEGWSNYVTAWGKLYRKELFNNIRFPEGKINEDLYIMYKVYLSANKIVYNDSELYFYRYREDSIMNKKLTYKNFDELEAFENNINFYIENKYYNLEKKSIHRYCYHLKCFYERFKKENGDIRGLKIIRRKHKDIKRYIKDKDYYTLEERRFINAPWCNNVLIEPYWYLIAVKNKINKITKGKK